MPPLALCRLQTHTHTHAHTGSSTCCWSRCRTTATAPCRRSHPSSDLAGICWLESEARTRTPSLVFNIVRLHGAGVALTPRLRLSAVKGIEDGSCRAKKRPRASSAVLARATTVPGIRARCLIPSVCVVHLHGACCIGVKVYSRTRACIQRMHIRTCCMPQYLLCMAASGTGNGSCGPCTHSSLSKP